jgi:hypothetical protein
LTGITGWSFGGQFRQFAHLVFARLLVVHVLDVAANLDWGRDMNALDAAAEENCESRCRGCHKQ